jgi:hypothetical protein
MWKKCCQPQEVYEERIRNRIGTELKSCQNHWSCFSWLCHPPRRVCGWYPSRELPFLFEMGYLYLSHRKAKCVQFNVSLIIWLCSWFKKMMLLTRRPRRLLAQTFMLVTIYDWICDWAEPVSTVVHLLSHQAVTFGTLMLLSKVFNHD